MTAKTQHIEWTPRPSTAAYNLEGLLIGMNDILMEHGAGGIHEDRRAFLALAANCAAAELYAQVLAKWFSTRMGDDHEVLEALQDRFEKEGWPIPGAM